MPKLRRLGCLLAASTAIALSSCNSTSAPTASSPKPGSANPDASQPAAVTAACSEPANLNTQALYKLTNQLRKTEALPELTYSTQLEKAAQRYAKVLADGAQFSHVGPDGSTILARVQATGYPGTRVGENLGAGQTSANAVMKRWQLSASHRNNLLSDRFSQIGIGYATGEGRYGSYWVQVFGNSRCRTGG